MNEFDLGEGYTLFSSSEYTIMQTIPVNIYIRWPISFDITIKVDNMY
jgi:hypothetical protein